MLNPWPGPARGEHYKAPVLYYSLLLLSLLPWHVGHLFWKLLKKLLWSAPSRYWPQITLRDLWGWCQNSCKAIGLGFDKEMEISKFSDNACLWLRLWQIVLSLNFQSANYKIYRENLFKLYTYNPYEILNQCVKNYYQEQTCQSL